MAINGEVEGDWTNTVNIFKLGRTFQDIIDSEFGSQFISKK